MDLDKDYSCHCPICSLCKAKRASFKHKKVPKSDAEIEFDLAKNPLVFDRYDGYKSPMASDWRHLEYEVAEDLQWCRRQLRDTYFFGDYCKPWARD